MSPSPVDPSFLFFFFCCCLVSQELASAKQRPADGTDLHYAARCPLLLLLRCDRLHAPSEKLRQPARPFPRLVSACAAAARTRPNTYPPSTWQPPDNSPVRDLFLFLFFSFFFCPYPVLLRSEPEKRGALSFTRAFHILGRSILLSRLVCPALRCFLSLRGRRCDLLLPAEPVNTD